MEIIVNGKSIPIIEYDADVHGVPSEALAADVLEKLSTLSLARQAELFRVINGKMYGERAYGEEKINRAFEEGYTLDKSEYCNGIIVQNGVIKGILWEETVRDKYAIYPFIPMCVYYAEDNNGAGYKTYEEYITLVCG